MEGKRKNDDVKMMGDKNRRQRRNHEPNPFEAEMDNTSNRNEKVKSMYLDILMRVSRFLRENKKGKKMRKSPASNLSYI